MWGCCENIIKDMEAIIYRFLKEYLTQNSITETLLNKSLKSLDGTREFWLKMFFALWQKVLFNKTNDRASRMYSVRFDVNIVAENREFENADITRIGEIEDVLIGIDWSKEYENYWTKYIIKKVTFDWSDNIFDDFTGWEGKNLQFTAYISYLK